MTEKKSRPFPGMAPNMPNMPNFPIIPGYPYQTFKLAHAYVPWQNLNQIFNPAEGLANGTIFPELVFPYRGKFEGVNRHG